MTLAYNSIGANLTGRDRIEVGFGQVSVPARIRTLPRGLARTSTIGR